ncbi:MAG: hypothetical protein AB7S39_15190 [Gemmatimonadales bacterium]
MTPRAAVLAVALGFLGTRGAAAQVVYEGAFSMTTGRYFFTERTTGWSVSSGLAVTTGPVTARISWPVWLQNTTLVSTTGVGGVPTGGPSAAGAVRDSGQARRRQGGQGQGAGAAPSFQVAGTAAAGRVEAPAEAVTGYEFGAADPFIQVAARIVRADRVSVSISGAIKPPVVDTARFGTGAWDYGLGASGSITLGRSGFLGLDAGYWSLGDIAGLPLNAVATGGVSVGYLAGNTAVAASLTAATSAIDGFPGPAAVSLLVSRLGRHAAGFSIGAGLTEASPDLSAGISWRVRLF